MSAAKYLTRQGGKTKQVQASDSSVGAGDAGKMVALDNSGRLDVSLLPLGVGVATDNLPASESLGAGDFVNIFSDSGTAKVRKADNSNGRPADGFVTEAVPSSSVATVHRLDDVNPGLSALTVGAEYWLSTAGGVTDTAPNEASAPAGTISQMLGKALSATELRTDDYGYVVL